MAAIAAPAAGADANVTRPPGGAVVWALCLAGVAAAAISLALAPTLLVAEIPCR